MGQSLSRLSCISTFLLRYSSWLESPKHGVSSLMSQTPEVCLHKMNKCEWSIFRTFSWYQAILAMVTGGCSWRSSEGEMVAYPDTPNKPRPEKSRNISRTWMPRVHPRLQLLLKPRWWRSETCLENFGHHFLTPRWTIVTATRDAAYIHRHFWRNRLLLHRYYIYKWFPSHTLILFTASTSGISTLSSSLNSVFRFLFRDF